MIALWPASSRGTEATVPIPPGLVRLMLVPWKSSAVSLFSRVLAISSSKEEWKPAKSRSWEFLIAGTIRLWEPSLRVTSTAIPRLTGPFSIAIGLPSRSPKVRTMTGISLVASTIAQATRWVKEVLRPRSLRLALIARRLASRVSTAIVRNEVAVGTVRLSSIALASIAAGPRSAFSSPSVARGAVARAVAGFEDVVLGDLGAGTGAGDRPEVDARRFRYPASNRRRFHVGTVARAVAAIRPPLIAASPPVGGVEGELPDG